ncbi:MAG: hypothetical protein WBL39_08545, partial [Terrimicrobiaceae bacterium]
MTATPRIAFITLVATLAYLGLAILGFGGFAAFFSHPALTALAIATFVMSGISVFSGGNLSPGEREDRANRWVIAVFGLIGLLSGYLLLSTSLHGPKGFLDSRWGVRSLAWRHSLYPRRRSAALASLCARQSVQRVGSHP